MDNLVPMRLMVAIADHRSLAAAGERLGLSPPATSRALAALEQRLGVQLVQRTTRRLRFTAPGLRFVEEARRILGEIEELERDVVGDADRLKGEVRLTAPVRFGELLVLPLVRELLLRHPEMTAEVLLLDRSVNLLEEGLDVAVRLGPLADSAWIATPVGRVRLVVCAAPSYLQQFGTPRQPRELLKHRLVSTAAPWRFSTGVLPVKPQLRVSSNAAAVEAAAAGWGVTRLPSYQVAPWLETGALRLLLEEFEPAPWPVHVLQPPARTPLRLRTLVDTLVGGLKGHPYLAPAD